MHGGDIEVAEGEWDGDVVLIEFPSRAAAKAWFASPAYQEIVHLRTEHSRSLAGILDGVPGGYRAADGLAAMLASR